MVAACSSSKELVKWRPGSCIVPMVVGCSAGPCCTCSGRAVSVDDQVGSMAIDLLETACCPSSCLVISGVDPGDVVIYGASA